VRRGCLGARVPHAARFFFVDAITVADRVPFDRHYAISEVASRRPEIDAGRYDAASETEHGEVAAAAIAFGG